MKVVKRIPGVLALLPGAAGQGVTEPLFVKGIVRGEDCIHERGNDLRSRQ